MPLRVSLGWLDHKGWVVGLNSFREEVVDNFVVAEFDSALKFGYLKLEQNLQRGTQDRLGLGLPNQ
jgi:hypothetical protein